MLKSKIKVLSKIKFPIPKDSYQLEILSKFSLFDLDSEAALARLLFQWPQGYIFFISSFDELIYRN